MTNIVLDTNIFISAALSPKGNPAKIIDLVSDNEEIQVFYTTEIFDEYKKVLAYKRLNIPIEIQSGIIKKIEGIGILIEPPTSTIPLPDESDRVFYDTAQASGAILITGNIKHFPSEAFIMTPSDFLNKFING